MAKRGPTPRAPADLRKLRVSVYLTAAELADLDRLRGGVGRGAWLRRAGLGQSPRSVPPINREAWAELARVAGNLNQHQRTINEGRAAPGPVDLAEIRAVVDALRRELLGVADESENQ